MDPGTDLGGTWSSSDPAGGSNPFSSLISKFTDNPASLLMAAPLAMQLFGGGQAQTGGEKQLQTLAANMNSQGQALAAPMQTGTLPPGAQSFVTADTNAAKAHVRSAYAAAGLSGSTAEAEALSAADERAAAEKFSFASDLLGKGLAAQGSTGNYYSELARMQMSRDQQFSNALSTFARGLASGGGGNYNWNQSQSG